MVGRASGSKLIKALMFPGALLFIFLGALSPLAIAQDTSKLVYDRCTECHVAGKDQKTGKSYWEGRKLTDKQWAGVIDNMVRYGARLNDSESRLTVEYLTAMSQGSFKREGTNIRSVRHINFDSLIKAVSSSVTARSSIKTQVDAASNQAPSITPTSTAPPATTPPTQPMVPVAPKEQAKTGVEMIWYLLSGGSLIGSGIALRNRERRSKKSAPEETK